MKTKDARKAFSDNLKKEKGNTSKANYKSTGKKLSSKDHGIHDQEDELICIRSTN